MRIITGSAFSIFIEPNNYCQVESSTAVSTSIAIIIALGGPTLIEPPRIELKLCVSRSLTSSNT